MMIQLAVVFSVFNETILFESQLEIKLDCAQRAQTSAKASILNQK